MRAHIQSDSAMLCALASFGLAFHTAKHLPANRKTALSSGHHTQANYYECLLQRKQMQTRPKGVTVENGINCTLSPKFERDGAISGHQTPFALSPVVAKMSAPILAGPNRNSQKRKDRCYLANPH